MTGSDALLLFSLGCLVLAVGGWIAERRCDWCRGLIWPWQRMSIATTRSGRVYRHRFGEKCR